MRLRSAVQPQIAIDVGARRRRRFSERQEIVGGEWRFWSDESGSHGEPQEISLGKGGESRDQASVYAVQANGESAQAQPLQGDSPPEPDAQAARRHSAKGGACLRRPCAPATGDIPPPRTSRLSTTSYAGELSSTGALDVILPPLSAATASLRRKDPITLDYNLKYSKRQSLCQETRPSQPEEALRLLFAGRRGIGTTFAKCGYQCECDMRRCHARHRKEPSYRVGDSAWRLHATGHGLVYDCQQSPMA